MATYPSSFCQKMVDKYEALLLAAPAHQSASNTSDTGSGFSYTAHSPEQLNKQLEYWTKQLNQAKAAESGKPTRRIKIYRAVSS